MAGRIFEMFLGESGDSLSFGDDSTARRAIDWAQGVFSLIDHRLELGLAQFDLDTGDIRWSPQMYELHGLKPGCALTRERALATYRGEDRRRVRRTLRRAVIDRVPFSFRSNVFLPDGSQRNIQCFGGYFPAAEGEGCLLAIFNDNSDVHRAHLNLQRAAHHDELTNTLNRRGFDHELSLRLRSADTDAGGFDLLLLDLDGFKDINDINGHLVGDLLLRRVADRLRDTLGPDSLVARWGGDEFAVVIPSGAERHPAEEAAKSLLEEIARPIAMLGRSFTIGASCGIANSAEAEDVQDLIRQADVALYEAKARKRRGAVVFSRVFEREAAERQTHLALLKRAIDADRLFAAYQPIVDLENHRITGMEALLRLRRERGRTLTAGSFLSALGDPWSSWEVLQRMLEEVCQDLPALCAAIPTLQSISINATQADLGRHGFADAFLGALEQTGTDPSRITLEITETVFMDREAGQHLHVLRRLHDAGVGLALDDFGTGFSSLAHLRDFPIDRIKIDASFSQVLVCDARCRAIVAGTLAMARALDIEVIAEGIEDARVSTLLRGMGCQYGQGFLFGKARTCAQIVSEMQQQRICAA